MSEDFDINLGPMDWRLFQIQRRTLIDLAADDRLTELEQKVLDGLLNLTDHIIDTAVDRGIDVPALNEAGLLLDILGDV